MSAFTCKVQQYGKGPKRIELLGDKTKRPESAQHVIEFPGGAIEVSRTTEGDYWAHIIVHRGQPIDDAQGLVSARGQVIGSRIGREHPFALGGIDDESQVTQIAVLIRTVKPEQPAAEREVAMPDLFAALDAEREQCA